MSHKGSMRVAVETPDPDETIDTDEDTERSCYWQKVVFCVFNSLYWVISVCILGVAAWQGAGATTSFMAGTSLFTYSMLAVALIGFTVCVLGFISSLFDHKKSALAYLISFLILMLIQLCMIMACGFSLYPTAEDVVKQMWNETSPYMLEVTASKLECCGHDSWVDTYASTSDIPVGCYNTTTNTVYTNGCGSAVITYFQGSALPSLITVLVLMGMIEVAALIFGYVFYGKLCEEEKTNMSEEDGHNTRNNNKIVPLMVDPIPEERAISTDPIPVVTARDQAVPGPSQTNNQSSMSYVSGRDVNFKADTPNSPIEEESKGNEEFIKLASVMLLQ